MSVGRGALIVLEGCDRAGKSTQAKMLVNALNTHNISVESRCFPGKYKHFKLYVINISHINHIVLHFYV